MQVTRCSTTWSIRGAAPGAVRFMTVKELACDNDCTAAGHIQGKPKRVHPKSKPLQTMKSQWKPCGRCRPRSGFAKSTLKTLRSFRIGIASTTAAYSIISTSANTKMPTSKAGIAEAQMAHIGTRLSGGPIGGTNQPRMDGSVSENVVGALRCCNHKVHTSDSRRKREGPYRDISIAKH